MKAKYSLYIKEDGYYRINLMNGVVEPVITRDTVVVFDKDGKICDVKNVNGQ